MSAAAPERCDVLIVGGGPGGSSAAAALAARGHRVVLLEKARHPRFHIGESLLPANLPLLERLGVAEQIRAIGLPKFGAQFHAEAPARSQRFAFADGWNKTLPVAYQVRRSEFDAILIRRAAELGATVIEECRAREVQWHAEGVSVQAEHGGALRSFEARYLIDASGRDTFLASRLGTKQRSRAHASCSMFAHFAGAWRDSDGTRCGDISLFWFEHGWFWFIPLADGTTSVGAVVWPQYMQSRRQAVREFFLSTLEHCPALTARLEHAELITEVQATGSYSYQCAEACGKRYLLVGDAYSFIDPVFSSGVLFAMVGGLAAAEALEVCLSEPRRSGAALRRFARTVRRGPKSFEWFIYRMTHPAMQSLFLAPKNPLRMREALLSLLAGDIFADTPLWPSLRAFQAVFFLTALGMPRRSWAARARRARRLDALQHG